MSFRYYFSKIPIYVIVLLKVLILSSFYLYILSSNHLFCPLQISSVWRFPFHYFIGSFSIFISIWIISMTYSFSFVCFYVCVSSRRVSLYPSLGDGGFPTPANPHHLMMIPLEKFLSLIPRFLSMSFLFNPSSFHLSVKNTPCVHACCFLSH